jgi:ABC-type sugar transport system ATPase subunit
MKRWPAHDPNARAEPVLRADGLVKQFAGRRVVDGVDLRCRAGQVLGLLEGKTRNGI